MHFAQPASSLSAESLESGESVAARKAALRERIRKLRRRHPPGLARARSLEAQQRLLEAPAGATRVPWRFMWR